MPGLAELDPPPALVCPQVPALVSATGHKLQKLLVGHQVLTGLEGGDPVEINWSLVMRIISPNFLSGNRHLVIVNPSAAFNGP